MKFIPAIGLLAALGAQPCPGQDGERGRLLYETHCGACHYERIHQRERIRSRIRSLPLLHAEVTRWATETQRPFTLQDLNDISTYLNRSHYRFEK